MLLKWKDSNLAQRRGMETARWFLMWRRMYWTWWRDRLGMRVQHDQKSGRIQATSKKRPPRGLRPWPVGHWSINTEQCATSYCKVAEAWHKVKKYHHRDSHPCTGGLRRGLVMTKCHARDERGPITVGMGSNDPRGSVS